MAGISPKSTYGGQHGYSNLLHNPILANTVGSTTILTSLSLILTSLSPEGLLIWNNNVN